jgi:hypothetical protein
VVIGVATVLLLMKNDKKKKIKKDANGNPFFNNKLLITI